VSGVLPTIKEAHLAGRWYPAEAEALERTVRELLAAGGPARADVIAVIAPHAAYQYSGRVAGRALASAGGRLARVIVLAPSHFARFSGAVVLHFAGYRTPLGLMPIDRDAVAALVGGGLVRANPAVFMREHALEVELPFLQVLAPEARLVPVLVGGLEPGDAAALAAAIRPLLGAGTLVVVSSDLTHYGRRFDYLPVPATDAGAVAAAVRQLDERALARIVALDVDGFVRHVEETGDTICGREPIEVLLRALPPGTRAERLAYATSLDVTGEFDHVVGYGAVVFAGAP
jgi:AmmeMemoRadiSam system protein B